MKLNIFGRIAEVIREDGQWVFYSLGEGKKRRENGLVIPAELSAAEVVTFLADIFHEVASPQNPEIKILDE